MSVKPSRKVAQIADSVMKLKLHIECPIKVDMELDGHHVIELDRDTYSYDDEAGHVLTTSSTSTTTTTTTTTSAPPPSLEDATSSFTFPSFTSNAGTRRAKSKSSRRSKINPHYRHTKIMNEFVSKHGRRRHKSRPKRSFEGQAKRYIIYCR